MNRNVHVHDFNYISTQNSLLHDKEVYMGTKINMLEYKNDSNDNFAFFTAIYIRNAD